MRLVVKLRMSHPGEGRAPWRFLEPGDDGVRVSSKEVCFRYGPVSIPNLYAPGHTNISILRNLASLNTERFPLVAATLGPIRDVVHFDSGYCEPVSEWREAAKASAKLVKMIDSADIVALSDSVTEQLPEHGRVVAPHDLPDFAYIYDNLYGVALYEAARDLFALIEDKPNSYRECDVCSRWIRMVRKDQLYCGRACTSKAHRDRQ
jgi:hypothetical protein